VSIEINELLLLRRVGQSFVTRWFGVLALASGLVTGCGPTDKDDDDPAKDAGGSPTNVPSSYCSNFAPCGGDITGRWRISATCTDTPITDNEACSGYASTQVVSGTATYDFGTDGVVSYAGSITSSYDITVTDECAQAVAHKDSAGYCQLLQDSGDDNPSIPTSISCSVDSVCQCHVIAGPISAGGDDTYVASGKNVTITTNGTPNTHPYCVSGNTLTLAGITGNPALIFSRN